MVLPVVGGSGSSRSSGGYIRTPSSNPVLTRNGYVARDSPYTNLPTPLQASTRAVGGSNGMVFGGGGFSAPSINFPAFQMPEIRIPTYTPPPAPKVDRLTYDQLLARINSDPGFLQESAGIDQTLADAIAAITSAEKLAGTEKEAQVSKLGRGLEGDVTGLTEEMAGSGALRSSITADREGRLRTNYQEMIGDVERAYNQTMGGYAGQRSAAQNQSSQNRTTARQSAINRYLSTRVNPTEVVY